MTLEVTLAYDFFQPLALEQVQPDLQVQPITLRTFLQLKHPLFRPLPQHLDEFVGVQLELVVVLVDGDVIPDTGGFLWHVWKTGQITFI